MTLSRRHFGALSAGAALSACNEKVLETYYTPFSSDNISIEGRFETIAQDMTLERTGETISGGITVGFPGIRCKFRCEGTAAALMQTARSDQTSWDMRKKLPDWVQFSPPKGQNLLSLSGSASPGHTLTIVKRTEAWQGTTDLHHIMSLGKITAIKPPPRRLLFIGDSITAGANNELSGADGLSGEIVSNARLSYGHILGNQLDAQVHLVAYGGKGLVRDWQGLTTEVTAPQYFERALPDDPNSVWNHSQYVPDAIGVCLGQNDFNQGIPDRENWVGTYVKFLRRIRETAPNAPIFVINSPMSRDDGPRSKGGVLLSYLDEITQKASDPLIMRANVTHYPGVTPTDGHPSTASHAKIAAELLPNFTKAFK